MFFNPQIGVPGCDLTGYHAKRHEFDHEYDNDAEMLISEISFNSTDTKVRAVFRQFAGLAYSFPGFRKCL